MHDQLRPSIDLKEHTFSFLGDNDFFKGEIVLNNDTFICSNVEGEVRIQGDHRLIIEPSGKVIGKIQAHTLELYGMVDGEIDAFEKVILFPSSIVKGRIKSRTIEIHPGATIDGDCHTLND